MTKEQVVLEKVTDKLGAFAGGLTYEDIPDAVRAQAKKTIWDNIGGILAGASSELGHKLAGSIKEMGEREEATIAGVGLKTSVRRAAMHGASSVIVCNGMSGWRSALGPGLHQPEVVLPVALALSQVTRPTGKEFIAALVAGLETFIRIGLAVMPSHAYKGFHQCASIGGLGGAVTAAKLMGLEKERMAEVIGTATIMTPMAILNLQPGFSPSDERYPMAKMLDSAQGAVAAVDAAFFTKQGFGGQKYPLEGRIGFCRATSENPDIAALSAGLGREFRSEQAFYKLYCITRWFHGAVDLTLQMMKEHNIGASDIERMQVKTLHWTSLRNIPTGPSNHVWECLTGSLSYAVAHTVLYPDEMFSPNLYSDQSRPKRLPDVHEYRKRIEVQEEPKFTEQFPGKIPTSVEILTKNGKTYSAQSDFFRGDEPELPFTDAELEDKFRRFAGTVLEPKIVTQIREMVQDLENVEDVTELTRLLVPSA